MLKKAADWDTINDFSLDEGDKIGLSGLSFSQLSFFGNDDSFRQSNSGGVDCV
ncbi:type I secretion C-terminal target domain-containing protein [Nostoc sp.]|uniref:type I secretion C-terminal target domain-containing protein n=1 Tax=Nostoc sp. TaxID=1180 RepID=UPI002FFD2455